MLYIDMLDEFIVKTGIDKDLVFCHEPYSEIAMRDILDVENTIVVCLKNGTRLIYSPKLEIEKEEIQKQQGSMICCMGVGGNFR